MHITDAAWDEKVADPWQTFDGCASEQFGTPVEPLVAWRAAGVRADSSSALRVRIPSAIPTLRFRSIVPTHCLPRYNDSLARHALQRTAAARPSCASRKRTA